MQVACQPCFSAGCSHKPISKPRKGHSGTSPILMTNASSCEQSLAGRRGMIPAVSEFWHVDSHTRFGANGDSIGSARLPSSSVTFAATTSAFGPNSIASKGAFQMPCLHIQLGSISIRICTFLLPRGNSHRPLECLCQRPIPIAGTLSSPR